MCTALQTSNNPQRKRFDRQFFLAQGKVTSVISVCAIRIVLGVVVYIKVDLVAYGHVWCLNSGFDLRVLNRADFIVPVKFIARAWYAFVPVLKMLLLAELTGKLVSSGGKKRHRCILVLLVYTGNMWGPTRDNSAHSSLISGDFLYPGWHSWDLITHSLFVESRNWLGKLFSCP